MAGRPSTRAPLGERHNGDGRHNDMTTMNGIMKFGNNYDVNVICRCGWQKEGGGQGGATGFKEAADGQRQQ
jgi:hypothetical protein